jgi:multicomponent Na+:H+ antiporter subunit G
MEMIRFIFAAVFLIGGVLCMCSAVFGMFRFKFVLNRMHTAATGDTLGLMLCMIGLIIGRDLDSKQ